MGGVLSQSRQAKQPVYRDSFLSTACKNVLIKLVDNAFYQATTASGDGMVICIGDVHGNLKQMKMLWKVLQRRYSKETLQRANIVFLGDYCDRGPDTKGVLDWLIKLKKAA